jgi:hypothetical protein
MFSHSYLGIQWAVTNNGYNSKADNINKLERKQVTIFRLRTGHCRLKGTSQETGPGLCNSAICDCGLDEEMPEHILKNCPLPTDRKEAWPEHNIPHKIMGNRSIQM